MPRTHPHTPQIKGGLLDTGDNPSTFTYRKPDGPEEVRKHGVFTTSVVLRDDRTGEQKVLPSFSWEIDVPKAKILYQNGEPTGLVGERGPSIKLLPKVVSKTPVIGGESANERTNRLSEQQLRTQQEQRARQPPR